MVEGFNAYSEKKGLNINLKKETFDELKTQNEYIDMLEHLLFKSKTKSSLYDLIMYDIVENNKYVDHLVGLNKFSSHDYIDDYIDGIVGKTCSIANKPISIPLYLEYNMLYSNQVLLAKHGQSVPKTWSELFEIAKYVIEEEKNAGNEIIAYSADISNSENGFASLYEFIYSYRNETDFSYPPITNSEVEEAMKQLKNFHSEFGEKAFKSTTANIFECLNKPSSNCLFVKTWNNVDHSDAFVKTPLPGKKDYLSGTVIGGQSIAINKNISDDRKELAAIVMEYFASQEFQKEFVMGQGYLSGSNTLLKDEECRNYANCKTFINDIQYVMRPIDATADYEDYSQQYRDYLLEYIYLDKNLHECLLNIEYLTKIFFEDKDFVGNRFVTMIIGITDIIIIASYILAFTKKFRHKFKILNPYYWLIFLIGLILIMSYGFTGMGELTSFKCRIQPFVLSVGFTLSTTLLCIRLIVNFPESDKFFVRFCENHMAICLMIAVGIDLILNGLLLIDPYEIAVKTDNHVMYNVCVMDSFVGHLFMGLIFLYKIIVALIMTILVFVEWNMKEFKQDIRYATATLFISIIIYIIYAIFNLVEIHGYDEEFIIPSFMAYLYGVSNYFLYFMMRFFAREEKEDEFDIQKHKAVGGSRGSKPSSMERYMSSASLNQTNSTGGPKKMSFTDHLMSLHNFGDEIKKTRDLSRNSNNSSLTNVSSLHNKKISRSTNNLSNNTLDEFNSKNRRASQICAIPENQIADIYSLTNDRLGENSGGRHNGEDSNPGTNKTHSYDNFLPRMIRINSTPNKKFLGYGQGRSYENFPSNSRFTRKNSNVSFTNAPNSTNNMERKTSLTGMATSNSSLDQKAISNSNISINKPINIMASEYLSASSNIIKSSATNDDSLSSPHNDIRSSNPYSIAESSFQSVDDKSDEK